MADAAGKFEIGNAEAPDPKTIPGKRRDQKGLPREVQESRWLSIDV